MAFIDDMETEGIPERILQLMRALELDTMLDICRRIKLAAEITRTADYQLERLRQLSAFKANYEKMIKRVLDLSDEQLQKLYEEVIPKGYARDQKLYQAAGADWVPFEDNETLQQLIKAVSKQTHDTLANITQTTGFYNLNGNRCEPLTQYFINILDKTHLEISTGVFSYDQALNKAVSDMAMSGMRWINYDNPGKKPWHNRVDVAARRAVMTGIVQVEGQIADDNAEKLDTEYFEVSAHATARPTHMVWQGGVYTKQQLIDICGLGTGPGLLGWNCYHHYDAFIPGISVRKYTDEELAAMRHKAQEQKEWRGKKYTIYEATQKQRKMETAMRACNEKIAMLKVGGGSDEDIAAAEIRRNDLYQDYRDFSKEFGLPEQISRVYTGINAKRFSGGTREGSSNIPPVAPSNPDQQQIPEASSASDIPGTIDTTWQWSHDDNKPAAINTDVGTDFEYQGNKYHVDGEHVLYIHDQTEEHIAGVIASYYQKRIWRLPKINYPLNIQTPDFFIGNYGIRYDLKTITGSGKNTLRNAIKDKEKQSHKFILNLTDSNLSDDEIKRQIADIFRQKQTLFVNEIVIMKNDIVIKSVKRK